MCVCVCACLCVFLDVCVSVCLRAYVCVCVGIVYGVVSEPFPDPVLYACHCSGGPRGGERASREEVIREWGEEAVPGAVAIKRQRSHTDNK